MVVMGAWQSLASWLDAKRINSSEEDGRGGQWV